MAADKQTTEHMPEQRTGDLECLYRDLLDKQADSVNKLPPVESWNPPLSGDIDIVIERNGDWYHEGARIKRAPLLRLFSTILKREGDEYFLVTPVEKWRIQVRDVPFAVIAVAPQQRSGEQALVFTTSTGDETVAGPNHPIRVAINEATGEPSPYVLVRKNLEGLIQRNVYYELVEMAETRDINGQIIHGVTSLGQFFHLA